MLGFQTNLTGQFAGVEGYAANSAAGLLAGINTARHGTGGDLIVLPVTSLIGALSHYVSLSSSQSSQPMKANFGLLPAMEGQGSRKKGRHDRGLDCSQRSLGDLRQRLTSKNEGWQE